MDVCAWAVDIYFLARIYFQGIGYTVKDSDDSTVYVELIPIRLKRKAIVFFYQFNIAVDENMVAYTTVMIIE